MTKDSQKDPQDGFDLIEYPCDFAFKAMCRVDTNSIESATEYIQKIVVSRLSESVILGARSNTSRTGKFESVTMTVRLESRAQLEDVYQAIARSERVLMTL